jgi:tripartite-type tricarboxylate transporter receptor subunit TctC
MRNKIVPAISFAVGILGCLALAASYASPSHAQTWPQRSVHFVLPLGAGSGADIGARLLADRLTKRWGQTVVVENRPGADGVVAINAVLIARDDHMLLFGPSSAFVAHPYLHDKMPYDQRELLPVARFSTTLVGLAAPGSLNVATLKDLMDLARAQPGKVNWATVTGVTDFIVAGYAKKSGIDMQKVPYRDTVQAQNDLTEGRIQMYIAALAIIRAQVETGRIKLLAMTNRERAPIFPNVPTVAEAGFPELEFDGLAGFFAARGIAEEVRERIAADVKAVSDQEIVTRLGATGQLVRPGSAAEFAASIKEQADKVAAFAQVLGIKPKQ